MNNFIFHCLLKPSLSIRWKKQNTKWPICFSLSHQLVSLLKFNTCRRKLCKILRSNQTAVSSPLRQRMVFPVQMSQDVVDAAFGCLRLSREQKPKFSKTKCFCISISCSACTVVGSPSKGTKWKLFSGKCLRDVVDAANHCLWAHTCLKLPFSFMSPSLSQLPPSHPRKYKFQWNLGFRVQSDFPLYSEF